MGVIVEEPMVEIRLQSRAGPPARADRRLGQLEEYFIEQLTAGDTFVFAGEVLRFEGLREDCRLCHPQPTNPEAEIPSYNGGKFPLSTFLAQRVREMVSAPERWHQLPDPVQEWLQNPGMAQRDSQARAAAGRDVSPRQPALSGLLSVRGPAGAPDAGHAAHPPAGARPSAARWALSPMNMRLRCGRRATWAGWTWTAVR